MRKNVSSKRKKKKGLNSKELHPRLPSCRPSIHQALKPLKLSFFYTIILNMKLSIFLALTSLIILASAAPIPHDGSPVASIEYETTPINQKRDVAEVDSQLSRTINRYSNSLNNFKNNVGKPSKIAKATKPKARKSPASSSSKRAMIDLTEVNDGLFWTGPVTAGSAPDTLQMNFDSGSADTL